MCHFATKVKTEVIRLSIFFFSCLDNVVLGKALPYGLATWLVADSQAQPASLGRQAKRKSAGGVFVIFYFKAA